jgi:hypothetical protein
MLPELFVSEHRDALSGNQVSESAVVLARPSVFAYTWLNHDLAMEMLLFIVWAPFRREL